MAKLNLNISVADPKRFAPAMAEAQQAGLDVSQSFADLGIASGSIDSAKMVHLRRIAGLSVEPDRPVSIPAKPGR